MIAKARLSFFAPVIAVSALVLPTACVGEAPGGGFLDRADAGAPTWDADPTQPDGGEVVVGGVDVSGMVMDYFAADMLPNTDLITAGLAPPITARAATDGSYRLANVPVGSTFYVTSSVGENYRPTRSPMITVVDLPVQEGLHAVSKVDTQRQYATLNVEMLPLRSIVIIDLRRNNGEPLEGVPAADITLLDADLQPAGTGPYFFGASGDLTTLELLPQSTAFNGRARAAFLNVLSTTSTLTVNYLNGQGAIQTVTESVTTIDDGATLTRTGTTGGAGGGGGGGPAPANLTFTNDVYPILQRAALGGDACANCHTALGIANFRQFDLDIGLVYQALTQTPGVVNLLSPAESTLLTKPLFEDPPNHPNATWPSTLNPSYQTVLSWIAQGAPL